MSEIVSDMYILEVKLQNRGENVLSHLQNEILKQKSITGSKTEVKRLLTHYFFDSTL